MALDLCSLRPVSVDVPTELPTSQTQLQGRLASEKLSWVLRQRCPLRQL